MGDTDHRGLIAAVADVLDTHVRADATVVLGVSGGPDSVALLHLVAAARPDLRLVVGHVRHGLRDDVLDAEATAANAGLLGASMVVLPVTVGEGAGPEDAARRARHAALLDLARDRGAVALLLGHTADDQAETLLLRIARGTGLDGLTAMRPAAERDVVLVVRPMLGLRRADVHAVSAPHATVTDPTNIDDPDQRRGRVRREALPALSRLRPDDGDPVPALARLAELVADDVALLDATAVPPGSVRRVGAAVVVDTPTDTAVAVLRRRIRAGWALLPGPHRSAPDAETVSRILGLPVGQRIDVQGGVRATMAGDTVVLLDPTVPSWAPRPLPVGTGVTLPELGLAYLLTTAVAGPTATRPAAGAPPWTAEVAMPTSGPDGVVVRPRLASGDRAIRKDLQRVPAALRDQVPIVAAADGTVLLVGDRTIAPAVAGQPCLCIGVAADGSGPTGYRGGP